MKDIPVHQLQDRATAGLEISYFAPGELETDEIRQLGIHRDDHYIFFLLNEGNASMMVDFRDMYFTAPALYYILPGQVHHRIEAGQAGGWFMAIDPMLVSQDYRTVFDDQLPFQQPHMVSPEQLAQCSTTLSLLTQRYENEDGSPFYLPVVHSLLQSFLGMAASCYCTHDKTRAQLSRPMQITQEFKRLLAANVRAVKSPSAYAAMLNISETYLNEALRKTLGLPVSYWILQEVMLEARRLLCYSDMNVKEIAHVMGYADHTYFSKLFKKATSTTPLAFRDSYRK